MQVTETSAEGLKREFKIVVPAAVIDRKVQSRLGELAGQVRLPGFRPGKVPIGLMRKRYGQAVRKEVLEDAIQEATQQTFTERNLRPALRPKVDIASLEEGRD